MLSPIQLKHKSALFAVLQIIASETGKLLIVTDPLALYGPQSCGAAIFGAAPGYISNGQVYVYQLGDDKQYKLIQTLQGNTSAVTGFGTDIGTRPLYTIGSGTDKLH